jgi:hypothetical protein
VQVAIALMGALLLAAAPALASRGLQQAPPQLPGNPAFGEAATSLLQQAMDGVTSLLTYSSADQQKTIATTPKPQPGAAFPCMRHIASGPPPG